MLIVKLFSYGKNIQMISHNIVKETDINQLEYKS
jgi:hypothetical protein